MIAIAIDGPAGAGKSSVAKAVAAALSYIYVDTGAMYRAVGLYVHRLGKDTAQVQEVVPRLAEINIQICYNAQEGQRIFLNGEDVSEAIRLPEISMAASHVSAMPEVRAFLLELQRNLGKDNNIVMDGRDIGTVIFPQAQVKIFLTASAEQRAKRRFDELVQKNPQVCFADVLAEMNRRDASDSGRAIAPLAQAEDATFVDTSGQTLEESVAMLTTIIKERLKDVL